MKNISIVASIESMKRKIIICAGLCLMSNLITVSAQIKLSFNPEMGKRYEYHTDMVQHIKQSVMGQEMPIETEMKITYLMEIKNKKPQETQIQFTYQDMTFVVSSAMMNSKYDSKKPTENPSDMDKMVAKIFNVLIDRPFEVVIAPNGSVKSVEGMDAIIENMLDVVAADGQLAAQMAAQMSQQFNDEAMKNMFGQSFNFYPDKAVKSGDSWNVENSILMSGMNLSLNSLNTLKEINSNMATIGVAGDIIMNMEGGKLTGKQTGTIILDTTSGIPTTSDISQNIKGTISAQGMEIQMEMTTKTKSSAKVIN